MKHYNEYTKEELLNLPRTDIREFDSMIIVPTDMLHDSGYKIMIVVAVIREEPIGIVGYGTDAIHTLFETKRNIGIDVLDKSELTRIFSLDGKPFELVTRCSILMIK